MGAVIHKIYQTDGGDLHVKLPKSLVGKRLEVTVRLAVDEDDKQGMLLVAEKALQKDWLTQDEDKAWEQL